MHTTLKLEGLHCQSCVKTVTERLMAVPGVQAARVSLSPMQAVVEHAQPVAPNAWQTAVQSGTPYRVVEVVSTQVEANAEAVRSPEAPDASLATYWPLVLLGLFLVGGTLLQALLSRNWDPHRLMAHFMGGFFSAFAFFKLLDVKAFAQGYRRYDLLAARLPLWGGLYPFLELGLGLWFFTGWAPQAAAATAVVLSSLGLAGVLNGLRQKQAIRCACLGTVFKLPLGRVTLAENLLMLLMGVGMLLPL